MRRGSRAELMLLFLLVTTLVFIQFVVMKDTKQLTSERDAALARAEAMAIKAEEVGGACAGILTAWREPSGYWPESRCPPQDYAVWRVQDCLTITTNGVGGAPE